MCGHFMLPSKYVINFLLFVNVATDTLLLSDDVFGWGKPQFNPPRMNLQLTLQPLAPAPGRRSLICHSNHGNELQHYCGAGPVAVP